MLARTGFLASCCLVFLVLMGTVVSATPPPGWQRYHDQQSGVWMYYPAGWTVERYGFTVIVYSPDRTSMALVQCFHHDAGVTAAGYTAGFVGSQPNVLPQGSVQNAQPQRNGIGDEVVDTVQYHLAGGGDGLARLLCLVMPRTGYLFAIAAPADRFRTQQQTLLRVLMSFAFDNLPGAAPILPLPDSLRGRQWNDPLHNAFSAQIPSGWKATGGMYQVGLTDYRKSLLLGSPDGQLSILAGDPTVPGFLVPDARSQELHQAEGSTVELNPGRAGMLLPYLPASDFNRMYVSRGLTPVLRNVRITGVRDMADYANQVAQSAQAEADRIMPGAMHFRATAALSTFTATSARTDEPVAGFLLSATDLATGVGQNAALPETWTGTMNVCVYPAALAPQAEHFCLAVLNFVLRSEKVNQGWQLMVNQNARTLGTRPKQYIQDLMMRQGQQFMDNAARSAKEFRACLGAVHLRSNPPVAPVGDNTDQFCNYLRDPDSTYDANGRSVGAPCDLFYDRTGRSTSLPIVAPNLNLSCIPLMGAPGVAH
ncbi:MAG: hypothetical protein ACYCW6_19120 [Candidatus Xenobia bacterium]